MKCDQPLIIPSDNSTLTTPPTDKKDVKTNQEKRSVQVLQDMVEGLTQTQDISNCSYIYTVYLKNNNWIEMYIFHILLY